jgi:hypothetical protein
MPGQSSDLHAKAQRVYALTDRLQVQLRVLEESHASVQQTINLAPSSENLDIEDMAFIVLMDASKSAQEDLSEIMESLKAIDTAKSDLHLSSASKPSQSLDTESMLELMLTVYGKDLQDEMDALQDALDAESELSEEDSLRLQMALDRMSKMMSMLSNLLKKISDTSSGIIQNLK